MDAQALEAAANTKTELDRTEELARALRTAILVTNADGPGSEEVLAVAIVAMEAEEFLRATGEPSSADRLRSEVAKAIDTALALNSYRLRIKLLRAGVHV